MLQGFISAIAVVILMLVPPVYTRLPLTLHCSEQLVPMFGLTELEQTLDPHTTLEKMVFLVENVVQHFHRTTTIISFGALLALISIRSAKSFFKKWWWIYRLPEVLIVVVISTSMFFNIGLRYDMTSCCAEPF